MSVWNGMKRTPMKRKPVRKKSGAAKGALDALIARDGPQCAYGGVGKCCQRLTVEHVIPRSRFYQRVKDALGYGPHALDNLVISCQTHNTRKLTRILIPRSHAHRLDEYKGLFKKVHVWDGGKLP